MDRLLREIAGLLRGRSKRELVIARGLMLARLYPPQRAWRLGYKFVPLVIGQES